MLTLRTLGECVIEIDGQYHGPQAPHVFGLLLYLAVERGRRVPRPTLLALLYPDVAEANAGHSFRQLLHRCRQIGAPLETGLEGVSLRTDEVEDDYSALFVPAPESRLDLQRATGGFLPGYAPRISDRFREWVEQQRAHVHGRIRRTLLAELEAHERAGRWEAAERTARCCLAIDPMNEQATFGLASALAAAGSRAQAVRLLDQYIAEAGASADAVRIPATVLRRRIAERLPAMEYDATRATFVGRAAEMAELNALLRRARDGECCTAVVWGEAGIGKTRLVAEFCKAAVLAGATVLRAVSQPHDVRRPMGAFLDLTPRLLKLPGALGTSPESMRYLQRLVTFDPQLDQPLTPEMRDPEYLAACITRALSELLDAVTSEAPLIVVVEDAQWLDRVSTLVLGDLLAERCQRRLLLVATWRATEDPTPATPFPERTRSLRVPALESADAERLVSEQLRQLAVPPVEAVLEWSVRTAQGNPFFLHELARHYAVHREVGEVPGSLRELLRNRLLAADPDSASIIGMCAVLGALATPKRIEHALQLQRTRLQAALSRLELSGLVRCNGETVETTHPLLSELAVQRLTPGVKRLFSFDAAEALADDARRSASVALRCAELWLDSGAPERAASMLLHCLQFAASLGQCNEALQIVARARRLTPFPDSVALSLAEIELAEAVQDHTRCIEVFAELDSTAARRLIPPRRLEQLDVSRLFALWRTGHDWREVQAVANALIDDTWLDETRIQLALLRLILAEEALDLRSAGAAYESILPVLQRLDTSTRDDTAIDLVFSVVSADYHRARQIASRMAARFQVRPPRANEFSTCFRVATALSRAGADDDATTLFETMYHAATSLPSHHIAFSVSTQCAAGLITSGHLEKARLWHNRANSHRVFTGKSSHLRSFLITEATLHLAAQREASAYESLLELETTLSDHSRGRMNAFASALEACARRKGYFLGMRPVFTDSDGRYRFPDDDAGIDSLGSVIPNAAG